MVLTVCRIPQSQQFHKWKAANYIYIILWLPSVLSHLFCKQTMASVISTILKW